MNTRQWVGFAMVFLAAAVVAAPGSLSAKEEVLDSLLVRSVQMEDIEVRQGDKGTDIHVVGSAPFMYTSYESGEDTLVIDLPGVEVGDFADVEAGTGEVANISVLSAGEVEGGRYSRLEIHKGPTAGKPVISLDPSNEARVHIFVPRAEVSAPAPPSPVATEPAAFNPASVLSGQAATPVVRMGRGAEQAPSGPPATVLKDIRVGRAGDALSLDLVTDGVVEYSSFMLPDPERLVIDLRGLHEEVRPGAIRVGSSGVDRIRIAQYQPDPDPVVRVVLDAQAGLAHRIDRHAKGLTVLVSDQGRQALPQAATASSASPPAATRPAGDADALLASAEGLGRPQNLIDPPAGLEYGIDRGQKEDPLYETQQPGPEQVPASLRPSFEAEIIGVEETVYTGTPITLDLRMAPIVDIFRLFHELSGLNIVVDPQVGNRNITIDVDNVPWDQVLDLILKTHGLSKTFEGNVLRIAPAAKLAQEEREQAALEEAKRLAVPMQTFTRTLSYARAEEVEQIITRIVRGSGGGGRTAAVSIVDTRTNTLIIRDIPENINQINDLIDKLDVPARQVMIEARIVETAKNFTQSFGIQWGFNYIASPEYGNQTDFNFPNSILLDGSALTGEGGLENPLGGYAVNLPSPSINSAIGISMGNILNTFQLDIALMALETKGKARIISSPRIIAQNNEQATIESGVQIPIVSTTAAEIDVTFVSASLTLTVTPQITKEDTVILQLVVENNSPSTTVNVGDVPGITTRAATTTVLVQNGGTTVIGGIYQANEGAQTSRTPFLHRIPLLGWLFKNKNRTTDNNELLIFVTPRILN